MITEMTEQKVSNAMFFLFIINSMIKTTASRSHSLSNKNRPNSVRRDIGNIGSIKNKDIMRRINRGVTFVLILKCLYNESSI